GYRSRPGRRWWPGSGADRRGHRRGTCRAGRGSGRSELVFGLMGAPSGVDLFAEDGDGFANVARPFLRKRFHGGVGQGGAVVVNVGDLDPLDVVIRRWLAIEGGGHFGDDVGRDRWERAGGGVVDL